MRRRIEALAEQLEEFVSEDAHDALVIRGDGTAAGLIGAAVDLLEQRGSIDVSIPLFEPFTGSGALAAALIANVEAFLEQAELERLAPRVPSASEWDHALAALSHLAQALGSQGDVRLALWLCPSAVADEAAYLAAVLSLVASAARARPFFRVAAREPGTHDALRVALTRQARRTLEVAVDMSAAAVRDALAEEAADPTLDPAARAAALLSAAMADAANGRGEDSLPVLGVLAAGFAARGDASSRALCFVLAGSVLNQLGRLEEARERVSQGLALAVEARAVPIVIDGAMLAGHLSMRAGDPADADVRFDVAARLAARVGSPLIVAEALTERGRALALRGMQAAACDAWTCAAEAARRARSVPHERAALSALVGIHRAAGLVAEAEPFVVRLQALERSSRASCEHDHAP